MLVKNLVTKPFEHARFKNVNECIICFDDFKEGDLVTPLPCRNTKLHVFHSDCIKTWFWKENICPLCKEHVSTHECKELALRFEETYPLQDDAKTGVINA